MAEKKTTQKVLSDKALERVMINVLGGFEGMLRRSTEATRCEATPQIAANTAVDAFSDAAKAFDPKLNS